MDFNFDNFYENWHTADKSMLKSAQEREAEALAERCGVCWLGVFGRPRRNRRYVAVCEFVALACV